MSLIPVGARWYHQPGPKGSSCVSIKGKHPIQVHMRCVGGVVKKLRASRDVSGSSPRLRRIVFTLPHDPFGPGYLTRDQRSGSFSPGLPVPVQKPGLKGVVARDKKQFL